MRTNHSIQNLYKADALAGSGKTFGAVQWAVKAARRGIKVAIIQPSHILLDQTERDLRALAPSDLAIHRIDGRTREGAVHVSTISHLKAAPDGIGEVLLLTHQTFFALPYWHRKDRWWVIVDEIPQVDLSFRFVLPDQHSLLTDLLEVVDHCSQYLRVYPREERKAALKRFRDNPEGDQVNSVFRDFAAIVLSPHYSTFIDRQGWDRTINGDEGQRLVFGSFLEPRVFDGFRGVVVMGAHFDESMLACCWASRGVRFKEFRPVKPRYDRHANDRPLEIRYIAERNWSKRLRNSVDDALPVILDAAAGVLGDDPFLWVANNDVASDFVAKRLPAGIRIPNVPHGLNSYQHVDNVVFLSALNNQPSHYALMERLFNIDGTALRDARVHQTTYQAIMRCSRRDPNCRRPNKVIVTDRATADWLAQVFEGASVTRMETGIERFDVVGKSGRPRKEQVLSPAERTAKKALRRDKLLTDLVALRDRISAGLLLASAAGTIYPDKYARGAVIPAQPTTNDELIALLHQCWREYKLASKEVNLLLAPALFDEALSEDTARGLGNIVYVNGFWLDQDGGELTVSEFRKFFPRFRFVAFNSFRGNTRYFFPTTDVMTAEVYHHIFDGFMKVLRDGGWGTAKEVDEAVRRGRVLRPHGIDVSKRVASSLFYLPCKAGIGESFWLEFEGKELDPFAWIEADPMPAPKEYRVEAPVAPETIVVEPADKGAMREARAHQYIAEYQSTPDGTGRHDAWTKLGFRLHGLGFEQWELEHRLRQADYDGSRAKKKDIRSLVRAAARLVRRPI